MQSRSEKVFISSTTGYRRGICVSLRWCVLTSDLLCDGRFPLFACEYFRRGFGLFEQSLTHVLHVDAAIARDQHQCLQMRLMLST